MKDGHPEPVYDLAGHCSIVYDNTLYAYSPAGFQALALKEGAQWQKLPMDISLTGAQCVKTSDRLYVVGGSPNATAADWNYPGLMHYTFSTKKWDWQRSESWNTQNRQNHGATYLVGTDKILVYSGSQKDGRCEPLAGNLLVFHKRTLHRPEFPFQRSTTLREAYAYGMGYHICIDDWRWTDKHRYLDVQ